METTNFISFFDIVDRLQYEPKEGHICPSYLISSLIPVEDIKCISIDSNYPKN